MAAKRKSKGAYMISSVAEMYGIHPQTLRLYEREGLLKPSRDLGVNIAGMAIILQMRERMEEMNRQMQEFVRFVQQEITTRASHAHADASQGAIIPIRKPAIPTPAKKR
jgi:MerR family transcriptional regulator/heat shock protein HspR